MTPRKLSSSDRGKLITVIDERWPDNKLVGVYNGHHIGMRPHHVTLTTATGTVCLSTRTTLRVD